MITIFMKIETFAKIAIFSKIAKIGNGVFFSRGCMRYYIFIVLSLDFLIRYTLQSFHNTVIYTSLSTPCPTYVLAMGLYTSPECGC